jgi:Tfp pilus assembly protein PilO
MKLSSRDRRALMLLAFSAVFFLFLNYVAVPWGEKFMTSGDDLKMAEKKLRRQKEMLASAALVDVQLKGLQSRLDAEEGKLLTGADPAQATAQLQHWIAQRASEQKVELLRSDFIEAKPYADDYLRVPVRVEMVGPITQVTQFINSMTHGDRIVSVDELNVNSGYIDKEKKVRCSMVVSALMRKAS